MLIFWYNGAMKIDLPVYDYKEEFTPISTLGHLLQNPDPSGICLSTIGGCAVPISGDRLMCDKALNVAAIIPNTTYKEFVGFVGFFMTMFASEIRKATGIAQIASDGVSVLNGEGKTIGLSSAAVMDDIGLLYVTVFLNDPTAKSKSDYKGKVDHLHVDENDLDGIHESLEAMFHNLRSQLFQQELSMRVSSLSI